MDWILKLEAQLAFVADRIKSAYAQLAQLKMQVWDMVTRHPEVEQDALDTFAALRGVIATKNVTGAIALVADVEKIVSDTRAAYTDERAALQAILAGLKALAS